MVKDYDAGKMIDLTIEKMNEMVNLYNDNSRPLYCAPKGHVDEIGNL